jgi:hypothetical protein
MLLIYGDPAEAPPEAQSQEHLQRWFDYTQELQTAGALKGGEALQMPDTATTVRVRDDETLLTDGPFAETKESVGGFYVVEVASRDEALELAGRVPPSPGAAVEVLPVVDV